MPIIIYQNIVSIYKLQWSSLCLLICVSLFNGWFIYRLNPLGKSINLSSFILALAKLYKLYFKIKGFGFKFSKSFINKCIIIKSQFTHRIVLLINFNKKLLYKSKLKFIVISRSITKLKNSLQFMLFFLKYATYKKFGIYMRGTIFSIKMSKKKMKF